MADFGRRRLRRMLLAAALMASLAGAVPAAADPQERLEEIRQRQAAVANKIDELDAQSDDLAGKIEVLDKKRDEVESRVRSLDERLKELQKRIDAVREELAGAQQRIQALTEELQDVLEDLDARTDVYSARAAAIYKAGSGMYVDGLLTADNFSDLYDRLEYYEASADADSQLIADIELLRDQTTTRREQVEAEEARIAKAKLRLEEDKAEIAQVRAEQAQVLSEREAVLGEKQALLDQVQSRKAAYERMQDQLERDAAKQTAILQAAGSSSGAGPAPVGGGQLAWPAAGSVTSVYGYRTHPIFGDRRLHTGIDIAAPYGTPVFAADSGTVVYAGVMSGYGNVIVVDHGGGLATTYNHLSAFYVGTGQQVSRSSRIGAVGCTGYCTGPNLHFEVRVNGTPVDPMPYLQ